MGDIFFRDSTCTDILHGCGYSVNVLNIIKPKLNKKCNEKLTQQQ